MSTSEATQRGQWIEAASVIFMALASLGATWSSYQSSLWGGDSKSAAAEANRLDREVGVMHIEGLQYVSAQSHVMLEAALAHSEKRFEAEKFMIGRLAPNAAEAYDRWMAMDPMHNAEAPRHPFQMEGYEVPFSEEAKSKHEESTRRTRDAAESGATSSHYLSQSVLLATVLFFLGISIRFKSLPLRQGAFWFGAALMGYALVRLVMLPVHW